MKLSLSVRVAESFFDKSQTTVPFDTLVELAGECGYDAICMRASVAGVQTPPARVDEVQRLLANAGLPVSMVTGDFAIPENKERGPEALRNITPYLDLAEKLGAPLLRVCMKRLADIEWAQRSADEASERGLKLAHQSHWGSLFETIEGSVATLEKVGRANFGIIYEPANLEACGEPYGLPALEAFRPHLFNVYVQNQLANPDGEAMVPTWERGAFRFDHIPLDDPRGIDWSEVIGALEAVGYEGHVTVHQALAEIMEPPEAARGSAEYLRTLHAFGA